MYSEHIKPDTEDTAEHFAYVHFHNPAEPMSVLGIRSLMTLQQGCGVPGMEPEEQLGRFCIFCG